MNSWTIALRRIGRRGSKRGPRRFLSPLESFIKRLLIFHLPLPSEIKWKNSLRTFSLSLVCHLQEARVRSGHPASVRRLSRSMYSLGRLLGESITPNDNEPLGLDELSSNLIWVMKSLDLAPKIKMEKETLDVSNYACPFLKDALKRGLQGPLICDALCGDKQPSLFLGLLWPFPWRIKYEVSSRMGDGGAYCQRVFTARSPDSSPPSH